MSLFSEHAQDWRSPEGPLWTLHRLNRLRVAWVSEMRQWQGARIIDVGCGGGLFSEAMSHMGAHVIGIDSASELVALARAHVPKGSEGSLDYVCADAGQWEGFDRSAYDAVFAFEVIEHLEKPEEALKQWMSALRPGGDLILSSPNRGAMSFWANIIAAEYLMRWVPIGTHRYHDFVGLDDLLGLLLSEGMVIHDVRGLFYYPGRKDFGWSASQNLHYSIWASRRS